MGSTQPFLRRALATAITPVIIAGGFAFTAASASADTLNPTPASAIGLASPQIDGVVWTQAVANGVDYLGGQFTHSRPAGAAAGTSETARANLLAMDVTTGTVVPGFNATTNGVVRAIATSADGTRIYIAGSFTTVNGQAHNRLAALTPDGQVISDFNPSVNAPVFGLAVSGSTVYLGGLFTQVDGQARSRAASVDLNGNVTGFAPAILDFGVRALSVSPDGSKVLLGGSFTKINGRTLNGLAAVSSSSGVYVAWPASSLSQNSGANSAIMSLTSRNGTVYATGYAYKSTGNLEGAIAMKWSDGEPIWVDNCHGDTYSSVAFDDALYTAGHAHNCSSIGGFPQTDPVTFHRGIAFSQAAGSATVQGSGAYNPLYGQPAPNILDWYPAFNIGTFTGQNQGPWSVTASNGYLIYAGEFTTVNGVAQQGIVRFQGIDDGAGTTDPTTGGGTPSTTVPARMSAPSTAALGPTRIAVRWSAPKAAAADKVTGYVVRVYKGAKLEKTKTVGRTTRLVTITGLVKSTGYRVGVAAKNAHGAGKLSPLDAVRTKAKGKNVSATKKPAKVKKPTSSNGVAKLRVKWTTASASGALPVSRYQVRVVLHGRTVKTYVVDDRSRSKLVASLQRRTSYTVSVRAGNWAGWGSWSTARTSRTK